LLSNGHARGSLRDVEALYYLEIWREKRGTTVSLSNETPKILVLGEYDRIKTERLLSIVTAKLNPTSTNFEIMFRDHPAAPIPLKLPNEVTNLSRDLTLNEAISRADVLISWAGTSAATVGYLQGKSLIMLRQYKFLNLSDLSPDKFALGSGAVLLTSPKDLLSSVLVAARPHKTERDLWTQFFNLDEDLPKWLSLIGEVQGTARRDGN
jgi:surface carbohydrate biosynthesis protein (TIGR04326 family)